MKRVARHALSTKKANKGFYKGTGSGSTGRHTQHGGYIIEWDKVRTYVVPPNLKECKVRIRRDQSGMLHGALTAI